MKSSWKDLVRTARARVSVERIIDKIGWDRASMLLGIVAKKARTKDVPEAWFTVVIGGDVWRALTDEEISTVQNLGRKPQTKRTGGDCKSIGEIMDQFAGFSPGTQGQAAGSYRP
jgi:hypothetical protein